MAKAEEGQVLENAAGRAGCASTRKFRIPDRQSDDVTPNT
jgi:hypothetical protein